MPIIYIANFVGVIINYTLLLECVKELVYKTLDYLNTWFKKKNNWKNQSIKYFETCLNQTIFGLQVFDKINQW